VNYPHFRGVDNLKKLGREDVTRSYCGYPVFVDFPDFEKGSVVGKNSP
jgi:hypothetical protein